MTLLALDTCFQPGGAALARETGLLGEVLLNADATHSKRLLAAADYLLASCGVAKSDLTGVAVSQGPGYFTGLRIGLATAQGLALGLGLPLAGVSSLRLLASGIAGWSGVIWAVADARRGLVYAAPFRREAGELRRLEPDAAYAPARLAPLIQTPALLVGDGARLYWPQLMAPGLELAPAWADLPRPGLLALEGWRQLTAGQAGQPETVTPAYCRPSDAEIRFGLPLDSYRLVE